jgi:dolichyl-phosphate beta-glucosyltransferase
VPCFREARRLPRFLGPLCVELERATGLPPVEILVVDDGSGEAGADALEQVVESERARHPALAALMRLPANIGKGGTVYAGWDRLAGHHRLLAFADADGAVPPAEVARLLALALAFPAATAVLASRAGGGHKVERKPLRRLAGLAFRGLVRLLFRLPVRDTQCGMKVVPAAEFRRVRGSLRESGFVFDIELAWALRAAGVELHEEPVEWHEQGGSHIRLSHALRMFLRVIALRRRLWARRVPGPPSPDS